MMSSMSFRLASQKVKIKNKKCQRISKSNILPGTLKEFGYSTKDSDKERQTALNRAIKHFGRTEVLRKLVAVQNLNKNRPIYTIFHKDVLYVEKKGNQRGGILPENRPPVMPPPRTPNPRWREILDNVNIGLLPPHQMRTVEQVHDAIHRLTELLTTIRRDRANDPQLSVHLEVIRLDLASYHRRLAQLEHEQHMSGGSLPEEGLTPKHPLLMLLLSPSTKCTSYLLKI